MLFLSNNKIKQLPVDAFSSLILLNTLTLGQNEISIVESKSFGLLTKLTRVDLQQNNINAIDELFIDNTGVQNLILFNNSCVNKSISDTTAQRETMKIELNTCFKNFEDLKSK